MHGALSEYDVISNTLYNIQFQENNNNNNNNLKKIPSTIYNYLSILWKSVIFHFKTNQFSANTNQNIHTLHA